MNEKKYDFLLNIETIDEQLNFNTSHHLNRYEPTLYEHLNLLLKHYSITKEDCLVDFGCGKGRLNFFLSHFTQATVIGIEMNPDFFNASLKNKLTYEAKIKKSRSDITFYNVYAQDYCIQPNENKFYFFNPFSVQIFIKVVDNILQSLADSPREIDLILYYPTHDYIYYLESLGIFSLTHEILLPKHQKDERERFAIYSYLSL